MGKSPTLYYKICITYFPDHVKYIDSSFIFAKQKRKDSKNLKSNSKNLFWNQPVKLI